MGEDNLRTFHKWRNHDQILANHKLYVYPRALTVQEDVITSYSIHYTKLYDEVLDENGKIIPGKHFVSPNLTPDKETGRIAYWTEDAFIKRFQTGRVIQGSPMPWGAFSRMKKEDLAAVYKYLMTLKPVHLQTPAGVQEGA